MNWKILLVACVGLAAVTPAFADDTSPRGVVEANMAARMRFAKTDVNNALAELKDGDKVKGCADLRAGNDDLNKVLELLAQDLELIKTDSSMSESARATELSKGQEAQASVTETLGRLKTLLQMQCA